ncbi:ribosomal protein [Lithospermum erythrorhizon]|uniref:Ribosomal protein n=1 Tax=Lithospermum erythrorhizon TaxID=34254 RepID=A0AAV3PM54_LITER
MASSLALNSSVLLKRLTNPIRAITSATIARCFSTHAQIVRTKFPEQHRGRMKGISSRGNHVCFGKYALQALEPAWITSRQIEAGRRAMKLKEQKEGRGRKLWVRIFPNKPVTQRPAETRMGRGKGSPQYCVAVVKPGRILYELSGVTEGIARKSISIAASKMPIRTQFIILK